MGVFQAVGGIFVLDVGAPGYQPTDRVIQFGLAGDKPLAGRWRI